MDWIIALKTELVAKPLHELTTQYVLDPFNANTKLKRYLKKYYKPVLSLDEIFGEVVADALEPVLIDPKYPKSDLCKMTNRKKSSQKLQIGYKELDKNNLM